MLKTGYTQPALLVGSWIIGALLAGLVLLPAAAADDLPSGVLFRDVADEVGLSFKHFIGATGEFYMTEIIGSGVALIDYDNDGDLDVYLLQGALLNQKKSMKESLFSPPSGPLTNKLFRNQLIEEGKLRFSDVTVKAGVEGRGFGLGIAVGDYDNDGDLDLYVTNSGSNILYRNDGDGTFRDVTAYAGVDDPRLSTGATFLDYDSDGDLDLFVLSYADFTIEGNKDCYDSLGRQDYCLPAQYHPLPDRLFQNNGDGTFRDVTNESGIASATGAGFGITCADYNSDGWIDVYIANDGTPNHLWNNKGDGTFEEIGLLAGVAFSGDGMVEAGMGVSTADFDSDGHEDIFVTNLSGETHALYRNDGSGFFMDVRLRFRLAAPSFPFTGFGAAWFDFDNDGDLDLFAANGSVRTVAVLRGTPYPYQQANQLFLNDGSTFVEITDKAGPALELHEVSRGAAFGDIDNDGDIDIVVSNNNGPVRLLSNVGKYANHWLKVLLQRADGTPYGVGSLVGLLQEGKNPLWRRAHTDGSYLSANDGRVHFGLGREAKVTGLVVRWLGGNAEVWTGVDVDEILTLQEGSGKEWLAKP